MYHHHHPAIAAIYAGFPLELQMAYQPTTGRSIVPQMSGMPSQQPMLVPAHHQVDSLTKQPVPMVTGSHHHHRQQQQQQQQQQQSHHHQPTKKPSRSSTVLWHTRPSTHVTCLYPEILSMIFGYLPLPEKGRVAQVCRSWQDASYHKSVWRGVEAKLHLKKSNPTLFRSLVERGIKRIQILSLQKTLKEVTHNVPNIDSLVLTGCFKLTDDQLMPAFGHLIPSLTELNLSMCKRLTDRSVTQVTQHLKNLESLDLSGCCELTNQALVDIEKNLRRLRRLSLRSCKNITDNGIAHLCGQSTSRRDSVPSLSSSLSLPTEAHEDHNADNMGLCCTLEYLGLQDCQKLTDDALKHVSLGLKNLQSINLSFCAGIFEFGLKHLSIMTELRQLNLNSCDNVTDVGIRYLSEGPIQLHSLDISFCDKIGDAGLAFVAQGMPQLTTLCLNSCAITDDGLVKLSQNLPDLKTLKIGQCSKLTDKGLNAVADNCSNLNSIDLYGCQLNSTVGLERILMLPHLNQCNLDLWQQAATRRRSIVL
ncbi:F-box/LRR-repeat protein 14 [Halotydeus destructor]|nr:F-box/LRR-repeat protein 14 [Halotydeus destructor]